MVEVCIPQAVGSHPVVESNPHIPISVSAQQVLLGWVVDPR